MPTFTSGKVTHGDNCIRFTSSTTCLCSLKPQGRQRSLDVSRATDHVPEGNDSAISGYWWMDLAQGGRRWRYPP